MTNHTPTLSGGDIRITPSPRTNNMGMFLFVVCEMVNNYNYSNRIDKYS